MERGEWEVTVYQYTGIEDEVDQIKERRYYDSEENAQYAVELLLEKYRNEDNIYGNIAYRYY